MDNKDIKTESKDFSISVSLSREDGLTLLDLSLSKDLKQDSETESKDLKQDMDNKDFKDL